MPQHYLITLFSAVTCAVRVFVRDVGRGLLEIGHNSLALVGLVLLTTAAFVASQTELRTHMEQQIFSWLQLRHEARVAGTVAAIAGLREPAAITRATVVNPKELSKEQHLVAQWIAKRYSVALEPVSRLVKEAWVLGQKSGVEPTLILAVMAIESSFNPFAQSKVGAQGLMQVMTDLHDDKYESFGGHYAAFDPVSNVRVGVQVLKDCITRAGSIEAGLKFYVGAANLPSDGGYADKVLSEQQHLKHVATGVAVPTNVARIVPAPINALSEKVEQALMLQPRK